MSKALKVKRFLQKKGSKDCGPVVTQSILDFYGIKKSLMQLSGKLKYEEVGTSLYDNGNLLLDSGLAVTAITANPILFSFDDRARINDRTSILRHLTALLAHTPKKLKHKRLGIKLCKEFLDNGGKMKLEIPTFGHIRKAIDDGKLVMALLYGQALGSHEGRFHFVCVKGYDARSVYLVNPLPASKKPKVPITDFMYALHASTCADVDNGSLLIVSKK
jgi:hypothetical protein